MTFHEKDFMAYLERKKMRKVGTTKSVVMPTVHVYEIETGGFIYTADVSRDYIRLNARSPGEHEGVGVEVDLNNINSLGELTKKLQEQFARAIVNSEFDAPLLKKYEAFLLS